MERELLLLVGAGPPRRVEAAEGGGLRSEEDPAPGAVGLGRGGARPGTRRLLFMLLVVVGVGRRRGAEGGGMFGERDEGEDEDEGVAEEELRGGGGGSMLFGTGFALLSVVDCGVDSCVDAVITGLSSLSRRRVGGSIAGAADADADALGVDCESEVSELASSDIDLSLQICLSTRGSDSSVSASASFRTAVGVAGGTADVGVRRAVGWR